MAVNFADTNLPVFPGARRLFLGHTKGGKRSSSNKKNLRSVSSIAPTIEEMAVFQKRSRRMRADLKIEYTENFLDWLWLLQLDFNILLYGVGDKKELADSFASDFLSNEDVYIIRATSLSTSNDALRGVRSLLDSICLNILKKPHLPLAFVSMEAYTDYIVSSLDVYYGRGRSRLSRHIDLAKRIKTDDCLFEHVVQSTSTVALPAASLALVGDSSNGEGGEVTGKSQTVDVDHAVLPEELRSINASSRQMSPSYGSSFLQSLSAAAAYLGKMLSPTISSLLTRGDKKTKYEDSRLAEESELVNRPIKRRRTQTTTGAALYSVTDTNPEWGKRYAHAQARLYVIVQGIDSSGMRCPAVQAVLARLAACSSVSLLVTADTVEAPLMWTPLQLSQFKWSFQHTPTYVPHQVNGAFMDSATAERPVGDVSVVNFILQSLTHRHVEVLEIIAAASTAVSGSKSDVGEDSHRDIHDGKKKNLVDPAKSSRGVRGVGHKPTARGLTMSELLSLCTTKMIARNRNDLAAVVKELSDQRLLTFKTDEASGADRITTTITTQVLDEHKTVNGW